jgi:hypothetical protein
LPVSSKRRFKEFKSVQEHVEFSIEGVEFTALAGLSKRVYAETVERVADVDSNGIDKVVEDIRYFLVSDEDRERFDELIESEEILVPVNILMDIWKWLLIQYKVLEPEADPKAK